MKKYIIGTRGSLLAVTQCTQIKNQLEELTGDQFELKLIKTEGDLNTTSPLWQMEGKDFFTKELDTALLNGEVDLVVHSYKDLGSERPKGIELAAITKRSFANDILLIKNSTIEKLDSIKEFLVGTSSPRRIVNIESRLNQFLPNSKNELTVKTKMLRGNVNTRIEKLRNNDYHAIVLAFPGIERLANSPDSKIELEKLLDGLNFMILPQSQFPSAASQGALGIECYSNRNDNGELKEKLQRIQHQDTVDEVKKERESFQSYGGGCHLAVGINTIKTNLGYIHIERGQVDNKNIDKKMFIRNEKLVDIDCKNVFIGLSPKKIKANYIGDQLLKRSKISIKETINKHGQLYVTSSHCFESLDELSGNFSELWSAGHKTWKALAKKGYWVNGCSDSLGDQELEKFLQSEVVKMISKNKKLQVLTRQNGTSTIGDVVPTYTREILTPKEDFKNQISEANVFYWTSYPQYQDYLEKFPFIKDQIHCCGLGKTHQSFIENNIKAIPFYDLEEFYEWTKK